MVTTRQTALTFTDETFAEAIGASLDLVEERLLKAVDTEQPLLRQSGSHLIRAGGKRFRPMLTLACAHLGDPDRPNILEAAVALELTHLATLYHDDVMDEAPVRRGAPSANARWDNSVAILTGDYLFSQAAQIMADLGTEAVRLQAATFARLVRGQINETMPRPEGIDAVEWHLGILSEKTGSLISTCAKFGAWFGGADEAVTAVAEEYGEVIGVAFQIADDIIDIASASDASGKTPAPTSSKASRPSRSSTPSPTTTPPGRACANSSRAPSPRRTWRRPSRSCAPHTPLSRQKTPSTSTRPGPAPSPRPSPRARPATPWSTSATT
nr:hypothetical protein GCM10025732_02180 [Glycomyces mayteni]